MSLLAYGLIVLAILGVLGGIGYKVRQSGYDACKVETLRDAEQLRRDEAEKSMQAGVKLEQTNAKARTVYRTITQQVDRVVDRVEYRDGVCLPPSGVSIANAALRGPDAATPEPDGRVSAPGATDGRDAGSGAAKDR